MRALTVVSFATISLLFANQTRAECGDTIIDSGEECDRWNLNGTACSDLMSIRVEGELACDDQCHFDTSDCYLCGDGSVNGPEECDDGAASSDTVPNACRSDCVLPSCGDYVTDSGEECDDGDGTYGSNSDVMPDACRTNCMDPWCGDGIIDVGHSEQCDLGPDNGAPGVTCNSWCLFAYCGNGIVDVGEECDWGPDNDDATPDSCRENCDLPGCGDDVEDTGEQCDDGYDNSDYEPDGCRSDCSLPWCGDGVVDPAYGEECDLGAGNSNDGVSECRLDCAFAWCGNGATEGNEVCDDGDQDDTNGCTTQCRPNVCGDSIVRTGMEACDSPDGCDYACRVPSGTCGDGVRDSYEECDAGTSNSNEPDAACRTDCRTARCGDGVVDAGEECDRSGDCSPECRRLRVP